jgi:hypothetical protein
MLVLALFAGEFYILGHITPLEHAWHPVFRREQSRRLTNRAGRGCHRAALLYYRPSVRPSDSAALPLPKPRPQPPTAGAAAAKVDMNTAVYPGATRADQLTAAYNCAAAVKAKLMTAPGGAPPPKPPPGAPKPPPPPPAPFPNTGNVANVLRYSFHDCPNDAAAPAGTPGGCNGALRVTIANMMAAGTYNRPNAKFPQDAGLDTAQNLLVGSNGVSGICGQVRAETAGCSAMPFADCISFAGLLAVASKAGTPPGGCPWVPGRVDYVGEHNAALLPSERNDADKTIATFEK